VVFLINLKQELEKFPAIDLKNVLDINPSISDNIKNSIVLYNKALESLKIDSEDIAIIELKKAIALNPDFHEAMNLLGLCYSYVKDYTKAIDIFEKVVAAENNSVQAIRYLSQLNSGSSQSIGIDNKLKGSHKNKLSKKIEKDALKKRLLKDGTGFKWSSDFSKYFIGFAAAMLLFMVIILGTKLFDKEPAADSNNINESSKTDISQTVDFKTKYEDLNKKYTELQDEASKANSEVDYYKNALKLLEVDILVKQNKMTSAADLLVLLKTVDFKGAEKQKFDNLYNDIMPKASLLVFNEGAKLMSSKKFNEALDKFNKIPIYYKDWANMDRTLYNIGKCYMSLQDSRNAVVAFQQIIDLYPKSGYAKFAVGRIKSLTQNP
jgi:tetratricopeptide (TPR) repeat protein